MAIPKILHYCWLGGEMRKLDKKCVKGWRRYFSNFEVMYWNEDNFNVFCNSYVKDAYEAKRYQYVSDYIRLWALYEYGGVYLDTDCKVKKSFLPLMEQSAFTGFGCDNKEIAACTLAFEPKHPFIKECLDSYENSQFVMGDGAYDLTSINVRMTRLLEKYGYQTNGQEQEVLGIHIYPMTYFCPLSLDYGNVKDCISKDTYSIALFDSKEFKREHNLFVKLGRKLGLDKLKRRMLGR